MDPRSVVDGAATATGAVLAEQAVFTSIRSPLGRGYRIVAASAGISPDEKREIVQRAPSHQSLDDTSAKGRGLASFAMQSGRRCVLLAQNAGAEHSARGDWRVHTHVLVLEPAAYRRLRCDPLAVAAVARAALGDAWLNDQSPPALARLELNTDAVGEESGPPAAASAGDVERLLAILSCLLQDRRVLAYGANDPFGILAAVWSGLPLTLRDKLSVSCGLRMAPGRNFALLVSAGTYDEWQRSGIEGDYALLEWSVRHRPDAPAFDPWLGFVRRRWAGGQLAELDRLSASLSEESKGADLARVAAISDDLARLADADLALLDELTARHALHERQDGVCARLCAEFHRAAAARRAHLCQDG
jgi:hypothetical protein